MRPAHCAERKQPHLRRHPPAGSAERFAAEALPQLRRLYPAALRMAGEESDAEELVAETYARAFASLGERGDAGITTWLYRNMADAAEEGGARDGAVTRDGGRARDGDPGGAPERRETPERLNDVPGGTVKDAMRGVPARSRFAVYLADVEGFSAATIARILRLPAAGVTDRLRRGRRQLRAALEARA